MRRKRGLSCALLTATALVGAAGPVLAASPVDQEALQTNRTFNVAADGSGGATVEAAAAAVSAPALAQAAPPRINPTGRVLTFVAPLKDEQATLGDVEVRVGTDDSVEVSAKQVFDLMSRRLDGAAVAQMRSLAEPGVFVPLARFGAIGHPIAFNPRKLELTVAIPAASRARQRIGLADLDRDVYGDFARPEPFSAYLNFRGSADYVETGQNTGFSDPLVMLDGAARLKGLVLESEGAWQSSDNKFVRDGTRAVWDDGKNLNRWTGGDLRPQSRGFQAVPDLAGISVERVYGLLDPQRNTTPRGGQSFSVDRASTVEAYVNGRLVRTIRLQPGTYDVSDFPFVQGSNDIQLAITDDSGKREVLGFSQFVDRTQLAKGLSEYGFYAGGLSSRIGTGVDYSRDLAATGFYRFGLSDDLTLGANFQYGRGGGLAGGEFVWGSTAGVIGGDVGVSNLQDAGTGWAVNLSYQRLVQKQDGNTSIVATVEARSREFGALGQVAPNNPYAVVGTLSLNHAFGDTQFVGGQVRYARGRGREDESSVGVTYGRRVSETANVVFDADYTRGGGGGDGASFRVAFVRRFGAAGSARAEYDSRAQRARVGYQTSGGQGVGAWSGSADVEGDGKTYGFNGSASYAANRADLGVAHTTAYSADSDSVTDQRTSFRMASSIAFAGGRFAVGRPVTDSFVIAAPYSGAHGVSVEVEPSPEGFFARSGALGPALYGQVSAYSPRTVTFDAPNAPPGFDVGQGALRVRPPYRAGYVATIGSEYGVTAIGKLLDASGEPVTLLSGYAVEQGPGGRRVQVFTNRQGQFGASGLKAGRWRIEIQGRPELAYDLVIAKTADGVARVGDLKPAS